jgi:tRNA acetyltransferase TAN1
LLQLASELWPGVSASVEADEKGHNDPDDGEVEEDLEKQIAKELAVISRPRREQRFGTLHTRFPHGADVRVERLIT